MSAGRPSLPPLVRLLVRLTTPALHRDDLERELGEELARARLAGGRPLALRVLVRELGGIVLHGLRDRIAPPPGRGGRASPVRWLGGLPMDLRIALRRLLRAPGFTAVASLTLALALAVTGSVFVLVDAFFLRPLPYHEPDRLVAIWETGRESLEITTVAPPNARDWEREARTLSAVAWFNGWDATLTGSGEATRVAGSVASLDLFDVLGVRPALGTGFLPEHGGADDADPEPVVVLSHGLWTRSFAADPGVLGRTIELNDLPYRVVGVMPEGFRHARTFLGLQPAELWVPLGLGTTVRDQRYLHVVGRLAEGATLASASAEMSSLADALARAYPAENGGRTVVLRPLHEQVFGEQRPILLLLLGAAGLVLLVACVNMANLLMARGLVRAREFAVRAALGSGRGAIVRQLLAEAAVLALIGGALGMGLVLAVRERLGALAGPYLNPVAEVEVDVRVLLFTLAAAAGSGLLFGALPALRLSRPDLRSALGDRSGGRGRGARARLVAVEAALTLVLLFGAGLLGRSLLRTVRTAPGFQVERTVLFEVRPPLAGYEEPAAVESFYDRLKSELEALPEIERVGYLSDLPLTSENRGQSFTVPASDEPDREQGAEYHTASPGYFAAAGIALLEGRDFGPGDDREAPVVAVVNRALARRHWGERSPLGEVLLVESPAVEATVVGVVESTADDALDGPLEPRVYYSTTQWSTRTRQVVASTVGPAEDALALIRPVVAGLDSRVPVAGLTTMEGHVARSVSTPRGTASLTGFFSALALLLAAVGIYGVLAHSVAERTRELGVRAALGARRGTLVQLVMRDSLRIVAWGIGSGVVLALLAGRAIASQLAGVRPWDPVVLAASVATVTLGALAAAWIPARRASRIDPLVAIRAE